MIENFTVGPVQKVAINLRWDISSDKSFRSNPDNYYHFTYQSSVDRCFVAALIMLSILMDWYSFGFFDMAYHVGVLLICLAGILICVGIVWAAYLAGEELFKWLKGYS